MYRTLLTTLDPQPFLSAFQYYGIRDSNFDESSNPAPPFHHPIVFVFQLIMVNPRPGCRTPRSCDCQRIKVVCVPFLSSPAQTSRNSLPCPSLLQRHPTYNSTLETQFITLSHPNVRLTAEYAALKAPIKRLGARTWLAN
jgi:hypothetical protein